VPFGQERVSRHELCRGSASAEILSTGSRRIRVQRQGMILLMGGSEDPLEHRVRYSHETMFALTVNTVEYVRTRMAVTLQVEAK
jgi:hypothetical protein